MADPRILYITSSLPYPLDWGGAIRQFHLLAAYARAAEVRLLFFYDSADELAGIEALKPYCADFHPVPSGTTYRESRFRRLAPWRRRIEEAVRLQPSAARLPFSPEMQTLVEELAPSARLIHVAELNMVAQIRPLRRRPPKGLRFVLDVNDIPTVLKRRMIQADPALGWRSRAFQYYDLLRLWRYQQNVLRSFDRVLVCSEKDQAYFGDPRVIVVPNGANVPPGMLPDESDGLTFLYLGMLSYWPNVDGLRFFLGRIFPLVRREVPGARLLVVGKNPPPEVLGLHDGTSIFVEANVPDVEKYYRQATVSVVPLRVGGGTRVKILEAFAMGRPVVSTSLGCEGLNVVDGRHLRIADGAALFAAACTELLRNPSLRQRLATNARQLVEERYAWSSIEQRFQATIAALLEEGSRSSHGR